MIFNKLLNMYEGCQRDTLLGSVEPHGQARGTLLDARGAEPLRSRVLLRRCLVGTASQQHPPVAFLPAQGRGFRRRRVKRKIWIVSRKSLVYLSLS